MRAIDFVIPGFSNWSRMNVRRAQEAHANETGLVLAAHYPPWGYKFGRPRRNATWFRIALDRGASLTIAGRTKPVWCPLTEGTHFIRVENAHSDVVFDTFFDVYPGVTTMIELWPALRGFVVARARSYRLVVSVPESEHNPAATKRLTHAVRSRKAVDVVKK